MTDGETDSITTHKTALALLRRALNNSFILKRRNEHTRIFHDINVFFREIIKSTSLHSMPQAQFSVLRGSTTGTRRAIRSDRLMSSPATHEVAVTYAVIKVDI